MFVFTARYFCKRPPKANSFLKIKWLDWIVAEVLKPAPPPPALKLEADVKMKLY